MIGVHGVGVAHYPMIPVLYWKRFFLLMLLDRKCQKRRTE